MNKNELIEIKKRIAALGLAGVLLGTSGCTLNNNGEPFREPIPAGYANPEYYYKYIIKDGESVKVYKSENVYLRYDKDTFEVKEYIFDGTDSSFVIGFALYDLNTEELLALCSNISLKNYNKEYVKYLLEHTYEVCLTDVSDYIEGYVSKDYYSLEEIKELEPEIEKSLRLIHNNVKTMN